MPTKRRLFKLFFAAHSRTNKGEEEIWSAGI
jgi:hypothetical protein